jgi:hypothetical protein
MRMCASTTVYAIASLGRQQAMRTVCGVSVPRRDRNVRTCGAEDCQQQLSDACIASSMARLREV